MLYKEWLDNWLECYVKPTVKNKTYNRYFEIVKKHLVPKLGNYDLEELKPIILQRFITKLMQNGNLKTGQGLSANSINGIIVVIRSSLSTAFRLGLVEEYAADKIKRPRIEEKTISCFSAQEQKKIEQAIMADKRDKMVGIILCLYTGLRLGELLALEFDGDIGCAAASASKMSTASRIEGTLYVYERVNGEWVYVDEIYKSKTIGSLGMSIDFDAESGVEYKAVFVVTAYTNGVAETETVENIKTCP